MTYAEQSAIVQRARELAFREGCGGCSKTIALGTGAKIMFHEQGDGTACTLVLCAACYATHAERGTT